jgi:ankyrin repeat protein
MNMKIRVWVQIAVLIAFCTMMSSGCCHSHGPSKFRTIHQFAIDGDVTGVATRLRANPSDLNLPDDFGQTPLHLASIHCRTNVVALLLDKGANIEARAKGGPTALHLAAQSGCITVATMLLSKGANVNSRDGEGRTPLRRALQWHQDSMAALLRKHGGGD